MSWPSQFQTFISTSLLLMPCCERRAFQSERAITWESEMIKSIEASGGRLGWWKSRKRSLDMRSTNHYRNICQFHLIFPRDVTSSKTTNSGNRFTNAGHVVRYRNWDLTAGSARISRYITRDRLSLVPLLCNTRADGSINNPFDVWLYILHVSVGVGTEKSYVVWIWSSDSELR